MNKRPQDCNSIEEIRAEIDELDRQIINLIADRFQFAKEIAKYKKPDKDSIVAQNRYDHVINNRRKMAEEKGLDADVIEKMYREMMNYFIREELKIHQLK